MKEQINKKKDAEFRTKTMMEKKRIQTEIVLRAKEAQRAATLLKEAEARSEAAKQVWKRKMEEARQTAREE